MNAEFTIVSIVIMVISLVTVRFISPGLFRMPAFWLNYAIVLFFEVLIDGWLTKLSAPIVIYDEKFLSGIRFPFDIPIEDFIFGVPLVVLPIALWLRSEKTNRP